MACHKMWQASTILVLCLIYLKSALSIGTVSGLKKLLIQSSNKENFSCASLSPHENELDTNETWSTTCFQIQNISTLLAQHSLISLPPKNSSRFFRSDKSSASLTILVKSFKQGMMFLNFSYFIGKTVPSESQVPPPTPNSTVKVTSKNLSEMPNSIDANIRVEAINAFNSSQQPSIVLTNTQSFVSDLNPSSVSVSIISAPPKDSKVPETVLVKPEIRRKRRSVLVESKSNTASAPGFDSSNDVHAKDPIMTTENTDMSKSNESTSIATPPLHASENLTNSVLDSLTLVQAVEMIKTAAAAISKGAATFPTKPVLGSVESSSQNDVSSASSPGLGQNVGTSKDNIIQVTEQSSPPSPPTTSPKVIAIPSNTNTSYSKETTTEIAHHNHHKSKKNKSESKKGKNKGKKLNDVERNEKDADSDDDDGGGDNDNESSTSSSSEEEEKDVDSEVPLDSLDIKPKISYKIWRASLEKKNRPPGLYVTVNDDIIFDNWEGIWDKNYVLGKWTGSKVLKNLGKWNQTSMFMNWDAVPVGRDVKITFEWEPVEDFEAILSDIEISTIVSPDMSCGLPEDTKTDTSALLSKDGLANVGGTEINKNTALDSSGANSTDNEESVIVLKHSKSGNADWKIVRVGKTKHNTLGQYENTEVEMHTENGQVKPDKPDNNPEDILRAILERLHNSLHANQTAISSQVNSNESITKAAATTGSPANTDAIVELEKNISEPIMSQTPTETSIDSTSKVPTSSTTSTTKYTTNTLTPTTTTIASTTSTTTHSTSPTTTPYTSSSTIMTAIYIESSSASSLNVTGSSDTRENSKPISKAFPPRKTDKETALLVSILTGSIALIILVLTVKKRLDISRKGRNATR